MSTFINNLNIFRHFPLNLKPNVKTLYISSRDSAYCVLNNNTVYGLGETIHEILDYMNHNQNYVIIHELCNIEAFFGEKFFTFARNYNNEIFSWGENDKGQLGRGYINNWREYQKPEKVSYFNGKNIKEICCGYWHCLALSNDGIVYGWGSNRYGQVVCVKPDNIKGHDNISTPIEIDLKEKIKFIHCLRSISFAVSFNGNAYYWGTRDFKNIEYIPNLIPIKNVEKVYCDSSKDCIEEFIILAENGKLILFNGLNEEIKEIKCQDKFIDLYRDYYCVLRSDECVYQFENNELIKTSFFNFIDFYSHKSRDYRKTIEISNYLEDKQIELKEKKILQVQFVEEKNNLSLNDSYNNFEKIERIKSNKGINKFKNFQLIKKIGSGSFGKVYKVKQNSDIFAIKRLEFKNETDFTEINFLSTLNSKFIVQYIDSWIEETEIDKFLFIQMEFFEQNLKQFLKLIPNDKSIETFIYFISCKLFKELIECVNYLHELKPPIIHRDLKPENILISNGNNGRFLKLCDFGLAKFHDKSSHTRMAGSWSYMAPEVFHSRKYNTKSDIYSLAMIGTEIFGFENKKEIIRDYKTREEFDKYLTKYSDQIKTKFIKLLDLLSKCLTPEEKEYNTRPECSELLNEIKEIFIDKNMVLFDINSMTLLNTWEFGKKLLL